MTTRGVLIIARNNSKINYIKQAEFAAKRVKEYLDLPVTLITDIEYKNSVFDKVIVVENDSAFSMKRYNNGIEYNAPLEFKNNTRCDAYDLSPYDETLLIDSDYVVGSDKLKQVFDSCHDFLIYDKCFELSNWRDLSEFDYISDIGPKFYWATVIFFRKSPLNKVFFDLVKHIQENWVHYQYLYQDKSPVYRNDHVFSIAIHIMNGFNKGTFSHPLPGSLIFTTDRDHILSIEGNVFKFLLEKQNDLSYFPAKIAGTDVHIMNKFSLDKFIEEQL